MYMSIDLHVRTLTSVKAFQSHRTLVNILKTLSVACIRTSEVANRCINNSIVVMRAFSFATDTEHITHHIDIQSSYKT